jgi:DNA-binding CsgD family transcriptional regulator
MKKEVVNLCKILFLNTPITFFNYERYYFDGSMLTLNHSPEMGYEIYRQNLLPSLDEIQENTARYVFLSVSLPLPEAVSRDNLYAKNIEIARQLRVHHRLCLLFKQQHYVEVFVYGISKASDPFNIFMNCTDFLQRFSCYFREASLLLIKKIERYRLQFDCPHEQISYADIQFSEQTNYIKILSELGPKNISFQGKFGETFLSLREWECLLWLAKGKTAKEIAKTLSLSHRTVEDYLANLRHRLGCQSRFELIEIAFSNPLIKAFLG